MKILNADLRLKIVEIIKNSGEGHIPSSFSIIDIVNFIYEIRFYLVASTS